MAIKSYLDMTGLDTFHNLVIASTINSSNYESTKTAPSIKALIDYLTVGDTSIGATIDSIQSEIENIHIELEKKSNTDENVKSTVANTTKAYLVASTSETESTGTLVKDTNVYLDTESGKLTATTFAGSLSGNADTSSQVKTKSTDSNSTHYISFVDSNNSSSTAETVYTDVDLTYNPSTNTLSTTTFSGSLSGNADTATKLKTAITINDTTFDGSTSITTDKWGQSRNISISDSSDTNTSTAVTVNGDSDVTLKLPSTIKASLTGNADTASVATKLGTTTVGSSVKPIYLNNGTPTEISYTLGTASQKDFPATGDASSTQVVLGNDSRLTDTRNPKAHTHSTDDIISGTLPVERGGTGISSFTTGDIIYASGTNILSALSKGTDGQVLKLSNGVPTWGTDNNTWKQNTTSSEGYVIKADVPNRIYAVGSTGNPTWLQLTNSMITDGAIENTKLENSSVGVGSATISLGDSATLSDIGAASASEFTSFKDATNEALALKENKSNLKDGAYKTVDTSIAASSTSVNLPTSKAVSDFVEARINAKIAASDAMIYKGTLGTGGTITSLPTKASNPLPLTGWTYKVITAGTYAGQNCEVGDMVVCLTDATASTDPTWTVIQNNIDGAVITSATSSINDSIVLFDGTTGNKIKSSEVGITESISESSNIPTASAVKSFVENKGYVTSSGVTSVALSLPGIFSVTGSPVTSTGTLTGTLKTQNVNTVFAGPSTGSAAAPTFRKLVAADLPGTYAGSSTAGGAATSANKLNTDAGGTTTPVYFKNGVPVELSYTISKSVPANAVFTDTHYTAKNVVSSSNTGTSNVTAATSNPYINLIENGAVRSTHRISGSGATSVKTDTSGNIIISSTDTKYTHPSYTARTSGLYNITVDATGHVSAATAVTKSDITDLGIPGSDTKVTQTAVADSSYTNYRPLIFGSSNSGTAGFTPTTVTDVVYACTGLYVRPSTGLIHATTFEGKLSGNATSSSSLVNNGTLDTQEKIDNFLEGSKLKYSTFKTSEQNNVGFVSNDGMIISIPWTSNSYGTQIALDDAPSGTIKVRSKANTWGDWKQLWKEGDSITAPSVTATNGFTGDLTGNASTATKLETKRSLKITDGTNTSTGVNFDGSADVSIKLPTTIKATFSGNLTGNVTGNADTATKLGTSTVGGTTTPIYLNNGVPTAGTKLGTAAYTNSTAYAASSHEHGAADITSGTLAVARGGTGKTTLNDAANSLINSLSVGSSTPTDTDYYVAQYAGGGETTTTYHRRPVSKLWEYIKGKADTTPTNNSGNVITSGAVYTALAGKADKFSVSSSNNAASWGSSVTVGTVAGTSLKFTMPDNPNTDAKTSSSDTSSKIYLVGATSQSSSGVTTYSDNQVYATNGQLDANKFRVAEKVTLQYNSTTESLDFIFA